MTAVTATTNEDHDHDYNINKNKDHCGHCTTATTGNGDGDGDMTDPKMVPHTKLVSDSEDDAEVVEAKAGEKQRREEEVKVERRRQKEARKEEVERQRTIDEARARMEQEQQEEMQAWAQAVTVTRWRNAGTIDGGSRANTDGMREVHGPLAGARGKARKACVWPLGLGGAGAATGSGTEASGKPAPRQVRKRAERAVTNASPRGGEKRKKVCTTTKEGEDDEDTEEVFRVPRVMAEEQCDALGMLTQALAQVAERMAAMEARDEERLAMEWEMMEIQRAHLAMARRAMDREEEQLELERVQTSIARQRRRGERRQTMKMRMHRVKRSSGHR
ncbi:hypothetical protein SCLCIDRAFT_28196 [Scleroderma citrinum Foug A]|uniref:Uncharacterized protein n=1 Tax=Scleroderma citrinum Foug A TaxID=1036808 RepID=A0A0C3DQM9_9AGAM|nr:hypothetical protein SCLCIDRAFT_28196 [Scleroderma citrinum Foug A]